MTGDVVDAEVTAGHDAALEVLRASAAPEGLVASTGIPHYRSLWTRDVAFAAMGANVCGDASLADAVRRSLLSLQEVQAGNGQIPNDYWPARRYWDFHEAGCTDATALFIVAANQHLSAHPDPRLLSRLWPGLRRAHAWLGYQDANQFSVIDSPMGGDWMDSTLQRSGKLLYVNALYLRATRGMAEMATATDEAETYRKLAERLRRAINTLFWPTRDLDHSSLLEGVEHPPEAELAYPHPVGPAARAVAIRPERDHYISHVEGGRYVDECDVLANVLAVLYDVADGVRARRIMASLHRGAAARPYPMRTYPRSFAAGDRWGMYKHDLEAFQGERWRNPPGSYHNGGVWPFIGGLYVVALDRVGMAAEARAELRRLTAANRLSKDGRDWGFHEWIHAETGEPSGAPRQTWSAGTYLLAVEALHGSRPVHL
jgi:glycogen debranching enzyme